jgi:hypothetical protein
MANVPLSTIAHGRSGDKGNHSNIAVIAYTDEGFAWLRKHLSADRVAGYFDWLKPSRVKRYEAANVLGLNFVLYDVLAGGASQSYRHAREDACSGFITYDCGVTGRSSLDVARC